MNIMLIEISMWVSQFLYSVCFIPQIITNARLRSASGISTGLLLAFFNGYGAFYIYTYSLGLPLAYQIMTPLQGAALLVLIFQRFWYAKNEKIFVPVLGYVINTIFYLACIPFAIKDPLFVGGIMGWISFVLFLINQLPQAIKVFQEKSVAGFSYTFVLIQGIAAVMETVVSLVAGLPMQTIMMALRGVVMTIVFSIQFVLYQPKYTNIK